MAEIGGVEQRPAAEFHGGVAIAHALLVLVEARDTRAQLPQRRPLRVLGAEVAGRIDNAGEIDDAPVGAPRACGRNAGIGREQSAQPFQRRVAHAA